MLPDRTAGVAVLYVLRLRAVVSGYATVGDLQLDVCQLNQSIQLTFWPYRRSQSVPDQSIFYYVSCTGRSVGRVPATTCILTIVAFEDAASAGRR
jgi:hypothetical protein